MTDDLDFSPLSDRERETVAHDLAHEGQQNPRPVPPAANAEVPEDAAARLFGRAPDALWRYHDAGGALVFCVCRWNKPDGDKDIRPLSWFDGEGWRLAAWPAPRPLYNLDKIAATPDALVIVCEGEKATDAAWRIFPDCVATTSSGGANAASRTDWMPLAGRRACILPDADEAGAGYARQVAAILAGHGCDVSVIDTVALARIDPNGGAREPTKEGWDASNAAADWKDIEALRKAVMGLAKPFESGPSYHSFGAYTMDARGLTVEIEKGRITQTILIAAPFEVLGLCRGPRGEGWGKMLRWRDPDGREHERYVADAETQGDPATLCSRLVDQGLWINRDYQRHFVGYLSKLKLKGRLTVVLRTGWHDIGGQAVFVLPGEMIGPRGGERVILDGAAPVSYATCGTIEEWREGPAKLASGHVLPVLAIATAFAGPLARLAGIEGGGVHFVGPSSIGKTTLLRLAASVWGRGDTPGFVLSWRATSNGLEGAAACATDTVLILDELGQVDGRELVSALYMLANGTGKARAHRDGSLRDPRTWRLMFLSSGEVPIDVKLAEDRGRKTRAGQQVRMLNIAADRELGCGVFDNPGPDGNAVVLAKASKVASGSYYGTAGPEFVRRLIAKDLTGDDVQALVNDFIGTNVSSGADGQVVRAAERLGLIAAAGELATEYGVTGWRPGEATKAATWAFSAWLEGRGGLEPAEVRQAIEAVRHFIEAHGEARFHNLDDVDARPVSNRAGWRRGAGEDQRWLIPSEVWKAEVCAGLDPKLVARVLAERGMVERAPDGFQSVQKIAGKPVRVYVITPRIFDGGGA
jgi:uncharacterized protein (DUF927 family)